MSKLKLIGLFTLMIFFLVSFTNANELRIILSTPQATFRANLSDTIDYYIGVENKNNFTINITINPPDGINITFQEPTQFELQPNQTKDINYSILIDKAGNYSYAIPVTYSGNGENFILQSTLFFIVSGQIETTILPNSNLGNNTETITGGSSTSNKNKTTNSSIKSTKDISPIAIKNIPILTIDKNNETIAPIDNINSKDNSTTVIILIVIISVILIVVLIWSKSKAKYKSQTQINKTEENERR